MKTLLASLLAAASFSLQADFLQKPEVESFIAEMVQQHEMDPAWLNQLFAQANYHQSIIDAISRPAEKTLQWSEYSDIFLTQRRVEEGREFFATHRQHFDDAQAETGVPADVILAILGVETFYGRITGNYPVLDALSTLAFDYPPRADFFRSELEHFLLLVQDKPVDPLALTGSYAGAMGMAQFISSSYRHYTVDADADGFADLWGSPRDAIFSIANYLQQHGWRAGEPVFFQVQVPQSLPQSAISAGLQPDQSPQQLIALGVTGLPDSIGDSRVTLMQMQADTGTEFWVGMHNFYVITRYNHSYLYGMAVASLATLY